MFGFLGNVRFDFWVMYPSSRDLKFEQSKFTLSSVCFVFVRALIDCRHHYVILNQYIIALADTRLSTFQDVLINLWPFCCWSCWPFLGLLESSSRTGDEYHRGNHDETLKQYILFTITWLHHKHILLLYDRTSRPNSSVKLQAEPGFSKIFKACKFNILRLWCMGYTFKLWDF